ncbi:hypothetical protein Clacol_010280 [Clathrus columnatus]|uniref:Amidohydrolase-related domain-containing protein n=1 Tax=Clathrus columnatus TaxID=1419009 RepID=A0AAV5ATA9_9AGAM|nr:hypothetical protein Clacol_010280 [Clathrus columnatus]
MGLPMHQQTPPIARGKDIRKHEARRGFLNRPFLTLFSLSILSLSFTYLVLSNLSSSESFVSVPSPSHIYNLQSRCAELQSKPGVPSDFYTRTESDRFQKGTNPVLIRNATIWTGENDGHEIVKGDVFLDRGIIQWIGGEEMSNNDRTGNDVAIVEANGGYITPGEGEKKLSYSLIDLHSHLGVDSSPHLSGASDTNSIKGLALPWLRALDGLNTHDDAYRLTVSGGVTTGNVLPGSANAIGGQAFPIKLRPTHERSTSSMLVEVPGSRNSTGWRQMKHACGENPSRVYSGTRMDTIWAFREAYNNARSLVEKQDKFCSAVVNRDWASPAIAASQGEVPEDLKWEALADVIRGKVKVHNHCYEAVDLDGIVRLTNEFKFPIAAFHHAHETYLVPNLLKKTWGGAPAVALFAVNGRYKREAFRGSEFAPRVLADNGIPVVVKSDHPVMNSRYLLFDAQQTHYYGLPANLALASVTTTPAGVLGLSHRIGYLRPGYDADVVIWDSHPLALGATPKQVYIDGIPQLEHPHINEKPALSQKAPTVPNFDKEREAAVKHEGLPPLTPAKQVKNVVFKGVKSIFIKNTVTNTVEELNLKTGDYTSRENSIVVIEDGKISCIGVHATCSEFLSSSSYESVDLENGTLASSFITFGSELGTVEIAGESSTQDGPIFDPLSKDIPSIAGGDGLVIQAVDGLIYSTRNALHAYRAGVTRAVVIPNSRSVIIGLGTYISTGAEYKLAEGAVIQEKTALHVKITHDPSNSASVSTQIALLRRHLNGFGNGDLKEAFQQVVEGNTTLVIHVESADIISSIIKLKSEIEEEKQTSLKVTIVSASEAHLIAKQIGNAGIGVILNPVRPYPGTWEQRRILPGAPLSKENAVAALTRHNITVGLAIIEGWEARNSRFDAAWIALETPGLSKSAALALVSTNLEKLLGIESSNLSQDDIVAYRGGDVFEYEAKVVGVKTLTFEEIITDWYFGLRQNHKYVYQEEL